MQQNAMQNPDAAIGMMEDFFKKAPALPTNARDFIVMLTPWIALIFGVLGVLGSLAGLGLFTMFSPLVFLGNGVTGTTMALAMAVLGLVASILMVMAYPGLKARRMSGWKLLFWSEVVSVLSSVIVVSLSGVLFGLLGFYLLFQIKSYYK